LGHHEEKKERQKEREREVKNNNNNNRDDVKVTFAVSPTFSYWPIPNMLNAFKRRGKLFVNGAKSISTPFFSFSKSLGFYIPNPKFSSSERSSLYTNDLHRGERERL